MENRRQIVQTLVLNRRSTVVKVTKIHLKFLKKISPVVSTCFTSVLLFLYTVHVFIAGITKFACMVGRNFNFAKLNSCLLKLED